MMRFCRLPVFLRFKLARFDRHRVLLLFVHRKQRHATDLFEIHPDRVVERDARRHGRIVDRAIAIGRLLFFLIFDDFDIQFRESLEEFVDALGINVFDAVEYRVNFFVRKRLALLAALDELRDLLFERQHRGAVIGRRSRFFTSHDIFFLKPRHDAPRQALHAALRSLRGKRRCAPPLRRCGAGPHARIGFQKFSLRRRRRLGRNQN